MFTFNLDGYIIFDQQLWAPLLTALDKGAPPPGTFRPKKKSCPSGVDCLKRYFNVCVNLTGKIWILQTAMAITPCALAS